jgi:mannose-6-phosphate isomerase-like protein (cupin superfamily)
MRSYMTLGMIALLWSETALGQVPDIDAPPRTSAIPTQSARAAKRAAEKQRRRIDFIPASVTNGALKGSRNRGNSKVLGSTLLTSGDEQTNFMLIRREVSGEPEMHARWDELMIIRSGTGAIVTGDSLVGSTYRAPGERAGGRFSKSYEIVLHAGDVIRIPAAVPHEVVVSGTQPLEYLLIKQRRQELPIRWFSSR